MKKKELVKIIREVLKEVVDTKVQDAAFSHVQKNPTYSNNLDKIDEMADMRSVERYADDELDPVDVEFGRHFFDRLGDPRNKKEITTSELMDFFARLANKKEQFMNFLQKYNEFVVKDRRTSINIPFMSMINQAIAKTIMRKPDFMTSNPIIALEGEHDPVKPGILKNRLGKLSCSKVRAERSKLKDKGTHYAKALQRYLNYHCQ